MKLHAVMHSLGTSACWRTRWSGDFEWYQLVIVYPLLLALHSIKCLRRIISRFVAMSLWKISLSEGSKGRGHQCKNLVWEIVVEGQTTDMMLLMQSFSACDKLLTDW